MTEKVETIITVECPCCGKLVEWGLNELPTTRLESLIEDNESKRDVTVLREELERAAKARALTPSYATHKQCDTNLDCTAI
jgi:hypothetical protein